MPTKIPPQDVQRALQLLGVTATAIEAIKCAPIQQALALLDALKVTARHGYKRMALELHPDRTGGDQEKSDLFVLLGRVLEEFEKTQVHPPPPQRPVYGIHPGVQFINCTFNIPRQPMTWVDVRRARPNTSTSTTNVGFTQEQVIRVVRMKPR